MQPYAEVAAYRAPKVNGDFDSIIELDYSKKCLLNWPEFKHSKIFSNNVSGGEADACWHFAVCRGHYLLCPFPAAS
jgi:hypothetical protein